MMESSIRRTASQINGLQVVQGGLINEQEFQKTRLVSMLFSSRAPCHCGSAPACIAGGGMALIRYPATGSRRRLPCTGTSEASAFPSYSKATWRSGTPYRRSRWASVSTSSTGPQA